MAFAPRTIGRCELFGKIARGGMATIHIGRVIGAGQFTKTVAIKRMDEKYAQNQDFVNMFLDEANLVSKVRHPNVVSTLDLIQDGDELLIVMEYVEGVTLRELVTAAALNGDRVPPDIAVSLIVGVLRGLHAAHEAKGDDGSPLNVVHRDVSPDNVLVGRDGYPRLIDFGIAKALDRVSSTNEGEFKGKIAYMAPEQVLNGELTRRSDVFMASIVLWELLTGKKLFGGKGAGSTMYRVLQTEAKPPSEVAPDVPPGVDTVVLRGLTKDPDERWASAQAMAETLEGVITPVSPTEISAWVTKLASERLATLRETVDEMLQAPRLTATASGTHVALASPASTPPPERSRTLVIALGVLAAFLIGILIVILSGLGKPSPPSAKVGLVPPEPVVAPSVMPATSAAPSASAVAPAPSGAASSSGAAASSGPPAPSSAPKTVKPIYPRPVRPVPTKPKSSIYGIE